MIAVSSQPARSPKGFVEVAAYPSKSNPDETHRVYANAQGELWCTCRGYRFNRKCWHTEIEKRSSGRPSLFPPRTRAALD